MTRFRILTGLAIAVSLVSFEPIAIAMPIAASQREVIMSNQSVVQVVTRAGVVHRSTRRTARRVIRRH